MRMVALVERQRGEESTYESDLPNEEEAECDADSARQGAKLALELGEAASRNQKRETDGRTDDQHARHRADPKDQDIEESCQRRGDSGENQEHEGSAPRCSVDQAYQERL